MQTAERKKNKVKRMEEGNKEEIDIVETTRVGIDYAEEAINFPWRFYIKNNVYVSKK